MVDSAVFKVSQGAHHLEGAVCFDSVLAWANEGCAVIAAHPKVIFDWSQVTQIDSSALTLLLGWARYAHERQRTVFFRQLPESLAAVAKLCGLTCFLEAYK